MCAMEYKKIIADIVLQLDLLENGLKNKSPEMIKEKLQNIRRSLLEIYAKRDVNELKRSIYSSMKALEGTDKSKVLYNLYQQLKDGKFLQEDIFAAYIEIMCSDY